MKFEGVKRGSIIVFPAIFNRRFGMSRPIRVPVPPASTTATAGSRACEEVMSGLIHPLLTGATAFPCGPGRSAAQAITVRARTPGHARTRQARQPGSTSLQASGIYQSLCERTRTFGCSFTVTCDRFDRYPGHEGGVRSVLGLVHTGGAGPLGSTGPGGVQRARVLQCRPAVKPRATRSRARVGEVQLKVSVVILVYNPGWYIGDCIESMIGESLPAAEYEALFVDDGVHRRQSRPLRRDRCGAHEHPRGDEQISGRSGKPRNDGASIVPRANTSSSSTTMTHSAPRRSSACTSTAPPIRRTSSLARWRKGMGGPARALSRYRPHATLTDDPLIDSPMLQNMFRRAFRTSMSSGSRG